MLSFTDFKKEEGKEIDMLSFRDFKKEEGIDYFVIEISENQIPKKILLNEGQWVSSGKNDWMLRVDAENPAIKQQRHVHIARSKHTKSKDKQVAWNTDGTKHDKKNFNSTIGTISIVQNIARQALNLDDNIKLEKVIETSSGLQLNESIDIGITPVYFLLKNN